MRWLFIIGVAVGACGGDLPVVPSGLPGPAVVDGLAEVELPHTTRAVGEPRPSPAAISPTLVSKPTLAPPRTAIVCEDVFAFAAQDPQFGLHAEYCSTGWVYILKVGDYPPSHGVYKYECLARDGKGGGAPSLLKVLPPRLNHFYTADRATLLQAIDALCGWRIVPSVP